MVGEHLSKWTVYKEYNYIEWVQKRGTVSFIKEILDSIRFFFSGIGSYLETLLWHFGETVYLSGPCRNGIVHPCVDVN